MYIELDGNGPLHGQLTRALKAAIVDGRLQAGSRLPATRLLANELGVSRNTVLAAYEQLRAEGFVDGRVGSGSYVAPGQHAPPATVVESGSIPPQSAYAARARHFVGTTRFFRSPRPAPRFIFHHGIPSTNPTLTNAWARELAHAALYTAPSYPTARGLPALREALCDYLARRRGLHARPDDILIVGGTQQAMTLAARVLLDPGDEAVIEDPQYWALRAVLQAHGARLVPVPVDADGLEVDLLPERAPRMVCVSPSNQFPLGVALSLERRMALLEYARRQQCWVFEDDYDGEFHHETRPLASLRSLDSDSRVVYVGTFSKVLFPSLRLGYMVLPPHLRADFAAAKWLDDFGAPTVEQAALARFIANGGFERHLRQTAKALRQRRQALRDGLQEHSRGRIEIADSGAGMHLVGWLTGRSEEDCSALVAHARERGLELSPISQYYLEPPSRAGLLLGYASLPVAEIGRATALLGHCLDEAFG